MSASRFYETGDPDGPTVLGEYLGIRPGDHVAYENPDWRQPDGSYRTGGLDGPLVVTEIIKFGPFFSDLGGVVAILNEGEWEVNADNLRKVEP